MLQLNPPLPMTTPKGPGLAHIVIDYGPEHHILWVVFINSGEHAQEIWTFANPDVRAEPNVTMGRELRAPEGADYTYSVSFPAADAVSPVYASGIQLGKTGELGMKYGPFPDRHSVLCLMDEGDVLVRFDGDASHIEGSIIDGRFVEGDPTKSNGGK